MPVSSPPTIHTLGRDVHALERIPVAGELLGLKRSSSFKRAKQDGWPLVGPDTSRLVLMCPFLKQHGIPYEIASGRGGSR